MGAMGKVMVTIRSAGPAPTLEQVRARYDLAEGDLDERFGVVEIAPGQGLYTVLVEESAAAMITGGGAGDGEWEVSGPFANPRIEPFGPPEP